MLAHLVSPARRTAQLTHQGTPEQAVGLNLIQRSLKHGAILAELIVRVDTDAAELLCLFKVPVSDPTDLGHSHVNLD